MIIYDDLDNFLLAVDFVGRLYHLSSTQLSSIN